MDMYKSNVDSNLFNISIGGVDIIAEDITPSESFNRRETVRKNIIGGTQQVIRSGYIPRDNTILTHIMIDPEFPNVYDEIFMEWMSKPVEIISKELGGKFNAELIIKKSHNDAPNFLKLEIQIIEVPNKESNIPNDTLKIPADELASVTVKSSSDTGKKKTTKKTNKTTDNKKKGNNITTTR